MEIDWEQRRYEVAKEMFAAMLANSRLSPIIFGLHMDERARMAFEYADVFIEELKKQHIEICK